MSLSDRRTFLLAALATLGGCGFQPVYGPSGSARGLMGRIEIAAPTDKNGFNLVRRLEERLGQPEAPDFALGFVLELEEDEVGITPSQTITRYSLLGNARFTLTELASDTVVASGEVDNFTSYAATGTTVSTLAAERDAYARLMIILADQIVARLLATSQDWAG